MKQVPFKKFTAADDQVWNDLFHRQVPLRDQQLHSIFSEGVHLLEIPQNRVPHIDEINKRLTALTGFKGVPVEGLEDAQSFFEMLSRREFPIGNFIRDPQDLSYTPAPDIFHDLYGHLPFLANKAYAEFSHEFGRRAAKYNSNSELSRQWERLYWFGVEFTLVQTSAGRRIFGAGIASSFGECAYALGSTPEVRPFDIEDIRRREYKIDEFQKVLYELESPEQLYSCLGAFERGCR